MPFKDKKKRMEWVRKYISKNKEKRKLYQIEWRKKNKGYSRKWAEENRGKTRDSVANWRKKNKAYSRKASNEWREKHPYESHYYAARGRCQNKKNERYPRYGGRGIKFKITKEELRALWLRDKAYLLKKPSIDRKDNDGNYDSGNCQFIELSENVAKRNRHHRRKGGAIWRW